MAKGSGTTRSGSSGNPKGSKGEKPVSQEEQDALDYYDSGEGMWINQWLRGRMSDYDLTEFEKNFLENLDKATDREIKDKVLYRSVDAQAVFRGCSDADYDALRSTLIWGNTQKLYVNRANDVLSRLRDSFVEKGFTSTTPHADVAEDWEGFTGARHPVVLKINISKHTKGVAVNSKVDDGVDEILLKRNQKVTVHKVYAHNKRIYVDVTI